MRKLEIKRSLRIVTKLIKSIYDKSVYITNTALSTNPQKKYMTLKNPVYLLSIKKLKKHMNGFSKERLSK
jgi:hypothetical protein